MPTTTAHGLPIPEETDPLGESDERITELADVLDQHLFTTKLETFDPAFDLLDLQFGSGGFADGGISQVALAHHGNVVTLYFAATFTAVNDLPVPANGDIANQHVFTINNPAWRPVVPTMGSSGTAGRLASYALLQDGKAYLVAVAPGAPISGAGSLFSGSFTFIRAGD